MNELAEPSLRNYREGKRMTKYERIWMRSGQRGETEGIERVITTEDGHGLEGSRYKYIQRIKGREKEILNRGILPVIERFTTAPLVAFPHFLCFGSQQLE